MILSLLSRTGPARFSAPALTALLLLSLDIPGSLHAGTISMGPYSGGNDGLDSSVVAPNGWANGASASIGAAGGSGTLADTLGASDAISSGTGTLSLGDGGSAILTFDGFITNGSGNDFVVFENSFDLDADFTPPVIDPVTVSNAAGALTTAGFDGMILASYLELAFVEVSSDGNLYARFPNTALTDGNGHYFDDFGLAFLGIDATDIDGLAGKHHNNAFATVVENNGTPFDLEALAADPLVTGGMVDLSRISHVRLIDVLGDGSTTDSSGRPIFDPHGEPGPTAGFDLDAVGAINFIAVPEPTTPLLLAAAATMTLLRRSRRPLTRSPLP